MLDAREYLHLAINAMAREEHHAALNYIKEVLALEPENATALYLLGAEHAELGLYDRAIEEMEQALLLDSGIEMARFQLGLLYLKVDRLDDAIKAFNDVVEHSQADSLVAYASGLVALCEGDVPRAREKLALGLSGASDNPALKKDMQELLNNLLVNQGEATREVALGDATAELPVYLGAYGAKN